jgi:hypothetical protein
VAEKQRYKIVEVPGVPETYANQFISGGFDGSSISINLGTARLIPQKMGDIPEGTLPQVFVTTRLMMSVPAAMEMVKQLSGMMEQMGLKMSASAQGAAPAGGPGGWIDSKN